MAMTDFWDQFPPASGFYKFTVVGETLSGVVKDLRHVAPFGNPEGDPNPVLDLLRDDGSLASVECKQSRLRGRIIALRPAKGDAVSITYMGEITSGAKVVKQWDVTVFRGGQS